MILFDTVRATSTDKKAPTRLRIADRATATLGLRAPVAIEVAIAFAVSWKPLVKSNANAVITTITRMNNASVTTQNPARRIPSRPIGGPAQRPVHQKFISEMPSSRFVGYLFSTP